MGQGAGSIFLTLLGVRLPIVCAPMGGVAGGALASAVSAAGGLGMVGMGSAGSPKLLRHELGLVPAGIRVGIGTVDWVVRRQPGLLDEALAARPVLVSVSFGTELDWVRRAHDAGIAVAVQVHDAASAAAAQAADADVLVARGLEGGGHGRPVLSRVELLPVVLAETDRPVLAAGAIATPADVREAVAAGAQGVWVGTAFAACVEALSPPAAREAMIAAGAGDTLLTSEFDVAAGYPWPPDVPERVLARQPVSVNAGLGVGHLTEQRPAADVVAALAAGLDSAPDAQGAQGRGEASLPSTA